MLTVFFLITTVICAVKWMSWYVNTTALIYYIKKKQYKHPSDDEMKECTAWVVQHIVKG